MGAEAIARQPRLYLLNPDGSLTDENGRILIQETVSDHLIRVPHLNPHVIAFSMPRGDIIGIKVIYQSHCWNVNFKEEMIGPRTIIMDGNRRRVFRSDRYEESRSLPALLMNLGRQRVYWTPADRNFGIYSATSISNGIAYTAFFTLAKERGRLQGSRHSLVMRVESAYPARQPARGMKVSPAAAIHACLKDKKLRYRP